MGYPFRIWFTGLCHFVLNRDPNALCRLCVVLPDARGEGHCDHVAGIYHVKRTTDEYGRMRIETGEEIFQLNRQRVAFGFTQKDTMPVPGNTDVLNPGLLWMGDIAGGFADQSDGIVSLDPPPTVTAQILLESLEVKFEDGISVRRKWEIPATLTGDDPPVETEVADPMFVEFTNVEGVRVFVYPMDTKVKDPKIEPLPNVREILIANRCKKKGYMGEIKVRQDNDQQISWVQVDKDFKFNFDMLSSSSHAAIKRFMGTEEVSFPVPESPLLTIKVANHMYVRPPGDPEDVLEKVLELLKVAAGETAGEKWFGTGTGSGGDCLGSQGLARFVDLDGYIRAANQQEARQALEARSASEPQSLEEPGAKLPSVPPKPETWKR